MENVKVTPGKFGLNYGVLLGIIMVLIAVIMYVTGMMLEGKQWPQFLYYLIFPAVIIIGIKAYKAKNCGFLKLGDALKVGLVIAIISALIYVIYGIIFNYVLEPGYIDKLMSVARDKMLENPNATEEQIEMSINIMEKMSDPIIGSSAWVGLSLFFGLIYSLVGGLVMKKDNPYEDA